MEARKPISLLKPEDNFAETWPDEPDRFTGEHVDPFLMWCVKQGSSDISIQSDRPAYN
jgi:defect-in-organelle-trafficking protein DotB